MRRQIKWDLTNLVEQVRSVCVTDSDECWIWTDRAGVQIAGYPQIMIARKRYRVNRLILYVLSGRLDEEARHSCDKPPCCNPEHLSWGSQLDNIRDRQQRGRTYRRSDGPPIPRSNRGEKHWCSVLTDDVVLSIRDRHREGETMASIARSLGLTYRRVNSVVKRHTWKHL